MFFAVPADHMVKRKVSEKRDDLDLARELKKLWNMKVTVLIIVNGSQAQKDWYKDLRTSTDHPNYAILEIIQNT